ncbi:DUF4367 domain-containing protein [Blautia obeum]|uniref:DUF4367 domain-containing protein n=1 Tax=Blautia obeum TaxID=40520 RepID=A0A415HLV4_9FIRM|nr:DUF4367 domain-containing protein [Blautia obeum]RHK94195.1 DUF4367 domain-containing protein [Blautia obeum]
MKKEFEKEQNDNQIDDAFLDMPDMEDDEKFRQWLEEEYLKEADAIEESLFDGRKFEDNQDIVEKLSVSRESFYQRAREEGLLEDTADEKAEDEKNTEEAVPESTEKKILEFRKNAGVSKDSARDENRNSGKRKHSYVRFGRIAGIAGLCLICVFAASMSSEANRKYLVNSVRILSGNDSQFITDNSSDNEHAATEESDAIADIEEKLDVKMPEFYYRPYGMEFYAYEVNSDNFYAKIEYEYENNILFFYIDKQDISAESNISSLKGENRVIEKIDRDDLNIIIKKVEDGTEKLPTYIASWEYENTVYYLVGKIEIDELKKIVKEMKF